MARVNLVLAVRKMMRVQTYVRLLLESRPISCALVRSDAARFKNRN